MLNLTTKECWITAEDVEAGTECAACLEGNCPLSHGDYFDCIKRNVKSMDLTVAQVNKLLLHPCNYCGNFPFGNGVEGPCDRCIAWDDSNILTVPIEDIDLSELWSILP